MLPKVAAAIIKHLKPISTKSADASVNSKVKEKSQSGQQKRGQHQGQNQGEPQTKHTSAPKLEVIRGGKTEQTPSPTADVQSTHSLGLGKLFSDFVHKLFAQDSYEKTSGQARSDTAKGKKGGLIDRKVI